ncbi:MAG TPA: nickel pincer cofactor biosynthesis protein LarC [Nitrospinaceae bacterium]|nr:nickel pincer cofactor biosynthesis protein LarC [Nitrospinaceae bacterium]
MKNKRVLYFDCFCGISGDMILGALVSLGVDLKAIQQGLKLLGVKGYTLNSRQIKRNGFIGTKVNVTLHKSSLKNHAARTFNDIKIIIDNSDLPQSVKFNSIEIFRRIGNAEAKVHGTTISKMHFHEVGAVDSIVDIVGSSLAIHLLGADVIVSSPVNTGEGFVKCQHGILPVPAPATLELLKDIPCYSSGIKKELTTPTGAVFIGYFAEKFESLPNMIVLNTGYGAGDHEFKELPNLLRVVLGKVEESDDSQKLKVIESNIDDMNPEFYEHVMELLFKTGAIDVFFSPVHMKKNRPGILISVITTMEYFDSLIRVLLEETSTLGVRYYDINRITLQRTQKLIKTTLGNIRVKIGWVDESTRNISPEYEDCRKIALEKGIPIKRVYDEALMIALKLEE